MCSCGKTAKSGREGRFKRRPSGPDVAAKCWAKPPTTASAAPTKANQHFQFAATFRAVQQEWSQTRYSNLSILVLQLGQGGCGGVLIARIDSPHLTNFRQSAWLDAVRLRRREGGGECRVMRTVRTHLKKRTSADFQLVKNLLCSQLLLKGTDRHDYGNLKHSKYDLYVRSLQACTAQNICFCRCP